MYICIYVYMYVEENWRKWIFLTVDRVYSMLKFKCSLAGHIRLYGV